MVKNTHGGNKHKGLARKSVNEAPSSRLRVPQEDGECFARVSKMSGNGMCKVDILHHGIIIPNINCVIRGKFRSRSKSQNIVSCESFVLVGLRDWASSISTCDLLEIFQPNLIQNLSSFSPSFLLLFNHFNNQPSLHTDEISFSQSISQPSFITNQPISISTSLFDTDLDLI